MHRYEGGEAWTTLERVGYEREIMAMALYNGKVYVGSLPMANVWRMDDERFTFLATLDTGLRRRLRRVWAMAVYQGRLFAGTLPSGRVYSMEAGTDGDMGPCLPRRAGATWRRARRGHPAALRGRRGRWRRRPPSRPRDYDVSNDRPLTIGFGANEFFRGLLSDLRLYDRPLGDGRRRGPGRGARPEPRSGAARRR